MVDTLDIHDPALTGRYAFAETFGSESTGGCCGWCFREVTILFCHGVFLLSWFATAAFVLVKPLSVGNIKSLASYDEVCSSNWGANPRKRAAAAKTSMDSSTCRDRKSTRLNSSHVSI